MALDGNAVNFSNNSYYKIKYIQIISNTFKNIKYC